MSQTGPTRAAHHASGTAARPACAQLAEQRRARQDGDGNGSRAE